MYKEYRCYDCKETKPEYEFSKQKPTSRRPRPVQNSCRDCNTARMRAWRLANPDKYKAQATKTNKARRFSTYGLTEAEYDAMILAQEGRCLICETEHDNLSIDHCHTSGVVRGLLCPNCNSGLGMFNDNIERMRKAIAYLEVDRA